MIQKQTVIINKEKEMRKLIIVPLCFIMASCGYKSRDNEIIGQVTKIEKHTPLFLCVDFNTVTISLGVTRNGIGSVSHEDLILYVPTEELSKKLKSASEQGKLVKIKYDSARNKLCTPREILTSVEEL